MAAPSMRSIFFTLMHRKPLITHCYNCRMQMLRKLNSASQTDVVSLPKPRWQLVSAVCLERSPIISAELNELQHKYRSLLEQLEFESSLLSDHEMWHQQDQEAMRKRREANYDDQDDDISLQTAQDFEDAGMEKLQRFTPASRITEADEKNDRRSRHRKLDRKLFLVVKQKLGNDERWLFPQETHQDSLSMRQVAERALSHRCGDEVSAKFIGNAPMGFYKYKFPTAVADEVKCIGAKVFFFKAYTGSQCVIKPSYDVIDYMWLTWEELATHLHPKYYEAVDNFLFE